MPEEIIKENEMFELANHAKVMGYRVNTISKLGFDCFLYKPKDSLQERYVLYDETSGLEVGYVQQNLVVSIEKIKIFLKRKSNFEHLISVHNNSIENGMLLPKFAKDIKINLTFNTKTGISFPKTEYLEHFVSTFGLNKYFDNIYNHKIFNGQNDYVQNNSCYVYCQNILIPKAFKQEVIEMDIDYEKIPYIDVLDFQKPRTKGNIQRSIIFKTTLNDLEYILAIYLYDMNTLLLSDISHSDNYLWAAELMKKLKEILVPKNTCEESIVLTIGADPEFELHKSGKNICGAELQTGNRLRSKIGCDGSGRQMEFRPNPKRSPEEATEEMKSIIDSISYHTVRCDGEQEPLGGHIHFGISKNSISGLIKPSKDMIKALDIFLGKPLSKFSGKARERSGYGKIGDYREQPWGFEYRTLPSAIFFTQEMCYICYKIAYNVIKTFIEKGSMQIGLEPVMEDYKLYARLTNKEYEYFINFEKVYNKETRTCSLTDNWTTKKQNPLTVIFSDTWDQLIKNNIIEELKYTVVTQPVTMYLYGIKEERGKKAIAGLSELIPHLAGATNVPHPKDVHCNEGIAIGLGIFWRNYITSEIINAIKRKIGVVNESKAPLTTTELFPEEMLNRSPIPNIISRENIYNGITVTGNI
jgi:hypothetical protein